MEMPQGALDAALEAARSAGEVLRRGWGDARETRSKTAEVDLVTEYDGMAESIIVERLRARFADHLILGEEGGERPGTSPFRWVVDPLDGTVNFAHGLPLFAVSLAL